MNTFTKAATAGIRSRYTTGLAVVIAILTAVQEIQDPDWTDINLWIKVALVAALVLARDGGTSSQDSGIRK